MTEVKRAYDGSRRRQEAGERRRAVVLAAQELFERDGFRQTTIAAVAKHAGVSAQGIYKVFTTKAELAKAVYDVAIAGDFEEVPMAQRPEAMRIRAEPDVRQKIDLWVRTQATPGLARATAVTILIRDARHVDQSLQPLWQRIEDEGLVGMGMVGGHLLGTGQLRPGLTLAEVRDTLWTVLSVDNYDRLVRQRGWTDEQYADWMVRTIIGALCP